MCTVVCGNVLYKKPYHSIRVGHSPDFGLPSVALLPWLWFLLRHGIMAGGSPKSGLCSDLIDVNCGKTWNRHWVNIFVSWIAISVLTVGPKYGILPPYLRRGALWEPLSHVLWTADSLFNWTSTTNSFTNSSGIFRYEVCLQPYIYTVLAAQMLTCHFHHSSSMDYRLYSSLQCLIPVDCGAFAAYRDLFDPPPFNL